MILIDAINNEKEYKNTYVALGNFDGVHKGHLTLVNKVIELAKGKNGLSMIYTFKNHPLHLIDKDRAPKLLMDNESKKEFFEKIGVDIFCLNEFTDATMKTPPREFIEALVKTFDVRGIVVGFNFRFGYMNIGDIILLESLSKELGFNLYVMDAYMYKGEVVSSTKIRESLSCGEVERAAAMLKRPYMLRGIVVDGRKLGRTIGFPTANLQMNEDMIIPQNGVYYTNVEIDKRNYKGITNIGNNPTVNGKNTTVETYILNFNKDIYDKEIKIYFIEKIREEKKFENLEALKQQLEKDKKFAGNQNIKINL